MRELLHRSFSGEAGQQALEILDRIFEEMRLEREGLIHRSASNHVLEPRYDKAEPVDPKPSKPAARGKMGRGIKPSALLVKKAKPRPRA